MGGTAEGGTSGVGFWAHAPRRARAGRLAVVVACAATLLSGCAAAPAPQGLSRSPASAAGCSSHSVPSGGAAVLVGATTAVPQGGFVTDLAAWNRLAPAVRQQFERALAQAAAGTSAGACVRTTADLHVRVARPHAGRPGPSGAAGQLVSDVTASAGADLPPGCGPNGRGGTECDTLFGFGADTTPFTVTGQITYAGDPTCVVYRGGQLCTGWFSAWGDDGTAANGSTGSGIGTSALAVVSGGPVRAEAVSTPSAIYVSHAPSGVLSTVTVTPYVTLLDLTVQSVPYSDLCAPTWIVYGVVTPNASSPDVYSHEQASCVTEESVDARRDAAARSSAAYQALRSSQAGLGTAQVAQTVQQLVQAGTTANHALVGTSHRGLPGGASGPPRDTALLAAACPVLNAALAPGTRPGSAFSCTQSTIPPWRDEVPGQSLVSAQLGTSAVVDSSGGIDEAHLILAFNTAEVQECWPVATCR